MTRVAITIPGDPVGKGRPRLGRGGHVFTPHETRAWERQAALLAKATAARCGWRVDRTDLVAIVVDAVKRRPQSRPAHVSPEVWASGQRVARAAKPDGSNVLKATEDALQAAGVVVDDAQFIRGTYRSWYAARGEKPCVEVEVTRL